MVVFCGGGEGGPDETGRMASVVYIVSSFSVTAGCSKAVGELSVLSLQKFGVTKSNKIIHIMSMSYLSMHMAKAASLEVGRTHFVNGNCE